MKKWNNDSYTRQARQNGFPARSVFKLKEIQKKYSILKKNDTVLDIGAAPGSWSLYVSQCLNTTGKIVGVDLKPLRKTISFSCPYQFISGNIFNENVFTSIVKQGPYSVILSDAAPSTTGDRLVDTTRSYELVKRILTLAQACLKNDGNLVVKIFQGGDSGDLLNWMKELFARIKAYKPSASRKKSTEIYYIGFQYEGI